MRRESHRVVVERRSLTVGVSIPADFSQRRLRGIESACGCSAALNGEASGLVPEVIHAPLFVDTRYELRQARRCGGKETALTLTRPRVRLTPSHSSQPSSGRHLSQRLFQTAVKSNTDGRTRHDAGHLFGECHSSTQINSEQRLTSILPLTRPPPPVATPHGDS